ncbi:diguanylate cyclase (GGDEF)-like protein/putative nucleotidyltransferase with HDIG domain [Metabacillus crassostreae]|nr:diguanylate cyclase [Metabacillus crassostreae]MBM7606298.1 diguanylate cyclase (GGDEF)-like protein/putative nucleotidyltransferase with HDIG domain [Metabacillus crassostreae]
MVLNSKNLYVLFIVGLSALLFALHVPLQVGELSNWVLIYTVIGAILLLNHFKIILPLTGNSLSMDSAIYLACIFLFGLNIPLMVLLLSSLIYFLIRYDLAWWKHLFNTANYTIMIISAYYVFLLTGGEVGSLDISKLWAYFISLTVYFFLNVFIMWLFYVFASKVSINAVLKGMFTEDGLKEAFTGYLCTLVLSLVLMILVQSEPIFGMFLFMSLSITFSFAFSKLLSLYKNEEIKARKDFLTGLYNHGYFKLELDEIINNADDNTFCIALLDLDDFKRFNDSNGHIQGDELLEFFGEFLSQKVKDLPYTAARYGGEEFGLIMPNTTQIKALSFINKIRKEYNDTPFKGTECLPLGCLSFSAGIAQYETGTYGSSELLAKADRALYYAKAEGKNNCQVYKEGIAFQECLQYKQEVDSLEKQLEIFLSKDIYTYQHSKRVFHYAVDMSEALKLTEEERRRLILGALIHDIGKLEIPRDIINKKSKLEAHEWEMMKKHVTYGKEILGSTKKYDDLLPLVELHHEHYNGKGYPYGLRGDRIPKLARILCVIDSFDAMTTERPYQKTKNFTEAIVELRKCSGQQFDPTFVEPFIKMIECKYGDKVGSEDGVLYK